MRLATVLRPLLLLLLVGGVSAARGQSAAGDQLPTGEVIPRVECKAVPEQSYALYLPSAYTSAKRWPIVFAFDPGAQGRIPVEQMKDIAEKHGYILAGSNNSRNGPRRPQVDAAQAMLTDVGGRFSVDMNRVYLTGFSGGARVAGMVAFLCNGCAAGVIANGAGLTTESEREDVYFPLFITVGDTDFNNEEVTLLSRQLEEAGKPNRLRVFPGPHQWPPAEVWAEAFEWMELLAMKQGRRAKDGNFVAAQLARAAGRAEALEKSDPFAAYEDYRRLAREFDALVDVTVFAQKAAELREHKAVAEGRKRQDEEFARSKKLWEELARMILAIRQNTIGRSRLLGELRARCKALEEEIERSHDPRVATAIRRALASAFAYAMEAGFEQMRNEKHFMAAVNFEAASEVNPKHPWPAYSLARAQALMGDRKKALRALQQAAENGMSNAALLREASEFAAWRDDADFQKILKRVEANRRP